MGSYNYTCSFSGLPIQSGDPVRVFLLSSSPYGAGWFPRTWPLKATYDDYGRVREVEEVLLVQNWLDGFKFDLIEKGWGDNSIHDCGVTKDMTFDQLWEAVGQGRVQVKGNVDFNIAEYGLPPNKKFNARLAADSKRNCPKGRPTLQRVKRALTKAGFQLFEGMHGLNVYMVDTEGLAPVRVRVGDFGGDHHEALKPVRDLLKKKYAVLIHPGSGSYSHDVELSVFPKPGTKTPQGHDERLASKAEKTPRRLKVAVSMVREDVWQEFLALKLKYQYSTAVDSISKAQSLMESIFVRNLDTKKQLLESQKRGPEYSDYSSFLLRTGMPYEFGQMVRNEVPYTVGQGTHYQMLTRDFLEGHLTEEVYRGLLNDMAEFIQMRWVLKSVGKGFEPSYPGGQDTDWPRFQRVSQAIDRVVKACQVREKARGY